MVGHAAGGVLLAALPAPGHAWLRLDDGGASEQHTMRKHRRVAAGGSAHTMFCVRGQAAGHSGRAALAPAAAPGLVCRAALLWRGVDDAGQLAELDVGVAAVAAGSLLLAPLLQRGGGKRGHLCGAGRGGRARQLGDAWMFKAESAVCLRSVAVAMSRRLHMLQAFPRQLASPTIVQRRGELRLGAGATVHTVEARCRQVPKAGAWPPLQRVLLRWRRQGRFCGRGGHGSVLPVVCRRPAPAAARGE